MCYWILADGLPLAVLAYCGQRRIHVALVPFLPHACDNLEALIRKESVVFPRWHSEIAQHRVVFPTSLELHRTVLHSMVARDMPGPTTTAGSRRAQHHQLLLIPRLQMLTLSHLGSRPWLLPLPVLLLGAVVVAVVGGLHV